MASETIVILFGLGFLGMLLVGFPVAVALIASALIFGNLGFGMGLFRLLPASVYGVVSSYTLMAIPLFVFMGVMLERSRLAEELLEVFGHVAGGLRGGMGLAIIVVGVLMGASTGIVGATVVTLGLLTLPTFVRRGYSNSLACGTICASGTLGQIIPPSLVLILLADIMGESVGTLFAAAMLPGLVLAGIYALYMLGIGALWPDMAPSIPADERAALSTAALLGKVCKSVLPPVALIFAVLGSIIGGVAAPTEAASMGALGSIVIAVASRRLSWRVMNEVLQGTMKITAMVFFILIGAQAFTVAFRGLRGEALVQQLFALVPGGPTGETVFMLGLLFILGFFIEWIQICYIVLPMFLPLFAPSGIDMVWLAVLVAMVLQTSFLTPPVGWALFFLKGVAPAGVTTRDIYVGVTPFVILQLVAVAVLYYYPEIALWLPRALGW
jgi:tripartite ATP-independent transporter DctM subunit